LDHSEQQHAQKTEPSFEPGTAAPPDMPAWRDEPAAPGALQRWGRRIVFLGVALLAMAAAGGLTLLGLDLYETHGSMEVVAANAPAQPPAALVLPERRSAGLPPLVLLPQDAKAAPKQDAAPAVALAAVPAPLIVVPPAPAPVKPKPVKLASHPAVKPQPAKLAAQPVVKPQPAKLAAQPVVKPKPAKLAAQPVAKPKPVAAIKKPVLAVKHAPAPLPAKVVAARAKPVKAAPAPAHNLGRDPAFDDPPPAAADRRCRPGELARECEARTR
jgi:hypothetical protein